MAEFLHIEVTGLEALRADLLRALAQLERPAELMGSLGAVLEANINLRFGSKTDPNGAPWAPLAASTRKGYDKGDTKGRGPNKGQVVRSGSLLIRTGQMLRSLTHNAGDDWVDVGMNRLTDNGKWQVPLLHETGTAHMPRRGIFLGDDRAGTLGAGDEADITAACQNFMDRVLGG